MTTATGKSLLKAYSHCAKRAMEDDSINTCSTSAGFIIPNGQKPGQREGYQVFVNMIRYSEVKLKKNRVSGGLLGSI